MQGWHKCEGELSLELPTLWCHQKTSCFHPYCIYRPSLIALHSLLKALHIPLKALRIPLKALCITLIALPILNSFYSFSFNLKHLGLMWTSVRLLAMNLLCWGEVRWQASLTYQVPCYKIIVFTLSRPPTTHSTQVPLTVWCSCPSQSSMTVLLSQPLQSFLSFRFIPPCHKTHCLKPVPVGSWHAARMWTVW